MKTLKENWSVLILAFICIYIMHLSSSKAEKVEKELEAYKKELDSIQAINDSLHSELFPIEIKLNRYEIAFEIFSKKNPKSAEQYAQIISEETE